ncbi:MAG: iron-sulfur cluster repair protein YtfE [Janthinobacterium svalbardensis]|uniref:Iron-sulfur cluster repair di-iron protein n=1 Tax=Janthinobacterium svalbardensis TaxID=368607 RepID=A0A290X2Q7_9BURK|nr:iron-sulfur cluster repair protein YtfE [Janthinobacterium svalbardensis]ATD63156.1 iron-sulfur cluster repair di-iron protein [Janthinobacterium svalbardensis]
MEMIELSLGQLARRIPGATRLFDAHRLDFCCGGNKTLRAAAAAAGVDTAPIVEELRLLAERADTGGERDWQDAPATELVEHILARYHAVHREQLPELIRLARKVEQVHGDRADCPHGLAEHLSAMAQELESHMRKEEDVLFPMIVRGQGPRAGAPINVMRMEHDDHGVALRAMEAMTNDITAPGGACTTWRALYTGLRTFRADLMAHIHTENNILFERFAPAVVH